ASSKSSGSSWRTWSDPADRRALLAIRGREDDDRPDHPRALPEEIRVLGLRDDSPAAGGGETGGSVLLPDARGIRRLAEAGAICRDRGISWRTRRNAEAGRGRGASVR